MLYLIYIFLVLNKFSSNVVVAEVEHSHVIPLKQLKLTSFNIASRHKMPVAKQAELLAALLNEVKKVHRPFQDEDPVLSDEQQRKLLRLLKRNYEAHQKYSNRAKNYPRTSHISNPEMIEKYQKRLKQMEGVVPTLTAEDYSSAEQELPNLKKVLRSLRLGREEEGEHIGHIERRNAMLHSNLRMGAPIDIGQKMGPEDNNDSEKHETVKEITIANSYWNLKPKQTTKTTKWKMSEMTLTTKDPYKMTTRSKKVVNNYKHSQYEEKNIQDTHMIKDSRSLELSNYPKESNKFIPPQNKKYTTNKYADDTENKFKDNKHSDSKYSDNKYADNKYSDNKYADNKYSDNKYSDNKYSDNKYSDNKYSDNKYSDNKYSNNKYSEKKYSENKYTEKKYNEKTTTRGYENTAPLKQINHYIANFNKPPRKEANNLRNVGKDDKQSVKKQYGRTPMQFLGKTGIYEDK